MRRRRRGGAGRGQRPANGGGSPPPKGHSAGIFALTDRLRVGPALRRRGSTSLEFGLVMPCLTVLLFVGLNWGWYLFQQLTVLNAAQRGTRLAAGASTARHPVLVAEQAVRAWLSAYGLDGESAVVTIAISPDGNTKAMTIQVALPFHTIAHLGLVPAQVDATVTGVYYGWMLDPSY